MIKKFKRVLVANRGEIAIRVFRACSELGIRTVAIYTHEDKKSLYRTKADESYLIGKNKGPIEAYLDIDEIINLAKNKGVDAIHPGYGFLSENPEFVRKCEEAGITFIGPSKEIMKSVGDKISSKIIAKEANVDIIPGIEKPISSEKDAKEFAKVCGYPLMLKASAGGGGRGMRIVKDEKELINSFYSARNEAKRAFGIDSIFIEKYLKNPKHIEVQIIGDKYGNILHLFERDCSIQRRHQKIVEYTPAFSLSEEKRRQICEDALKIARKVGYINAGTVEFLVDSDDNHYFIEVNPRIQVEHTITEMITGIDIVQTQIKVAQGYSLNSEEINLKSQDDIKIRGYSIQCRITTENPNNNFAPDTGQIDVYRSGSGFGIRLDGGNAYTGSVIGPYYDSLLVKIISHSRTFEDAARKAIRSIRELTVRGVKTNSSFITNILKNETFLKGNCDTNFIKNNPQLLEIRPKRDKELKLLTFLGEKIVNEKKGQKKDFDVPIVPHVKKIKDLRGTKQILDTKGPQGVVDWIKKQDKLLLTETTMRDAQQSLMATRLRTVDMLKIAKDTSTLGKDLFSLEMWGGATFDVSYRFLKESPWDRLVELRKRVPNVLFQMLIRGSNGVGYKNYPDNVIRDFIRESADAGIDVFRIFDSLNWINGMEVAIDEVLKLGKIVEASICYTGDILDTKKDKYTLDYYVKMAKRIENTGAHILAIKDMSALLKPYAAYELIKTLKEEVNLPIHLHTHDTSGNGVATVIMAAEAGVDICDTAFNSMSGLTSQPALNSIAAALENTHRDTGINLSDIQKLSDYWSAVRPVYEQFESDLKSGTTEIYKYEIPGGQYSNLKPQVESFGLGHRFEEVKEMFKKVNEMVGDIVKVTPSSKMVGDLAIFMVKNDLTPENIYEKAKYLTFPDSVYSYFKGMMGQPIGGFPKELKELVLKGEESIDVRPGELLAPHDYEKDREYLIEKFKTNPSKRELLSYALYPKVYEDYLRYIEQEGDFSRMGSDIYFHGLSEGETCEIEIEEGKILIVKLVQIGKLDDEGNRTLTFEVNGNKREVNIKDKKISVPKKESFIQMKDSDNPLEIGASIPGSVYKILVEPGEEVEKNQPLIIIEAMKMEVSINSTQKGVIDSILVKKAEEVKTNQLLIKLK